MRSFHMVVPGGSGPPVFAANVAANRDTKVKLMHMSTQLGLSGREKGAIRDNFSIGLQSCRVQTPVPSIFGEGT